jgi:hypothetical protein
MMWRLPYKAVIEAMRELTYVVAFTSRRPGLGATAISPAPEYILASAARAPALVIWDADGRFTRLEGDPCDEYEAALAVGWRLWPA